MAMIHFGKRARLLSGCAMAMAIGTQAHGQAFNDRALQGNNTVQSGNVTVNRSTSGPNIDTITVNSPQAIVNWATAPTSSLPPGPVDFLPSGSTANFVGSGNYTVLNRVMTTGEQRAISLNGTVSSGAGGSVWFYSAGGIIAGPTAVFNVGNLILTANDIDATGGLFDASGAIRFRGVTGSNSQVEILSGARINLTNPGSYLAVVAPLVTTAGTVKINGSAAYIAGEGVDVRINSGLFDINFIAGGGTSATGTVLSHTGTTTSDAGDYSGNGVFFAAMPKNQAISMLLGGTVGYQPAASASVQNGIIVLSAGANIVSGTPDLQDGAPKLASILIGGGNYTSSLGATATDTVSLKPGTGQSANFTSSVGLRGPNLLAEANNASISIGGSLMLEASQLLQGGNARLSATNNGSIDAGSYIQVNAQGRPGGQYPYPDNGDNVKSGTISLTVDNGRISTPGTLALNAYAEGGTGNINAGSGEGGIATVSIKNTNANSGVFADNLYIDASGEVGYGAGGLGRGGTVTFDAEAATLQVNGLYLSANGGGSRGDGARAAGGTIDAVLTDITTNMSQLSLSATAYAGSTYRDGGIGGGATGGTINLLLQNLSIDLTNFDVGATASGGGSFGRGGTAGAATGGFAMIDLSGATVDFGGTANFSVTGTGGYANVGTAAAGTGGSITLSLQNNSTLSTGDLRLEAFGYGGSAPYSIDENSDNVAEAWGIGGKGTGGTLALTVNSSTLQTLGGVTLSSNGYGGVAPIGGAAQGGAVRVDVPSGQLAWAGTEGGTFTAEADAVSGATGLRYYDARVDTAHAGNATGGDITFDLGSDQSFASASYSAANFSARGTFNGEAGGQVGQQGDVRGGRATLTIRNALLVASDHVLVDVGAEGAAGFSNTSGARAFTGGNASGGTANLNLGATPTDANGAYLDTATLSVLARGVGGEGRDAYQGEFDDFALAAGGGSGTGGAATLNLQNATLIRRGVTVLVDAGGQGGLGGSAAQGIGASGGDATGGAALATLNFAQINGSITVDSSASGGGGGSNNYCDGGCSNMPFGGAGAGGNALGGTASLDFFANTSTVGAIKVLASGTGGAGGSVFEGNFGQTPNGTSAGRGGNAAGGPASVSISSYQSTFDTLTVGSFASGGDGGTGQAGGVGGNAAAGNTSLRVANTAYAPTLLSLDASSTGGAGGNSAFSAGVAGGNALSGTINVLTDGGGSYLTLSSRGADFDSSAIGGNGGISLSGGHDGGRGGSAQAGTIDFTANSGTIDGDGNDAVFFNLAAQGGFGGYGTAGTEPAGTGGNGAPGGDAIAGRLSFTGNNLAEIVMTAFEATLAADGGGGGNGGQGGQGATGTAGIDGGIGQNGGTGGVGGTGGIGGNGASGGEATGGHFSTTSQSGAALRFGSLNLVLTGRAGLNGYGGDGGAGGTGGIGGNGGVGIRNANGTYINPGAGGNGGTGGTGGRSGSGGDGANATGGEFTLAANGGTITADGLNIKSQAFTRDGGYTGIYGFGGTGGNGGQGGLGAQENLGPSGNLGNRGGDGEYGFFGQQGSALGGLIDLSANTDGESLGTFQSGFAQLDTSAFIDGEPPRESGGQGTINIGVSGAATTFIINNLSATAGTPLGFAYGGLINITGTDATLDLNNTTLTSAGGIDIHLSGRANIVAGESFRADASDSLVIAHDGLTAGGFTIRADDIRLNSRYGIDTTSSRLSAFDSIDIQSTFNATVGDLRVAGGIVYADFYGPHGAEIRLSAGRDVYEDGFGPHAGNIQVNGIVDATGSVGLNATGDITVNQNASVLGNNRVNLIADGDVTVQQFASVVAGRGPVESGYGQQSAPFEQNGMLTISAGANPRGFDLNAGDISSVQIGGSLEAFDGAIVLSGTAIDGTGSSAHAQYVRADIFGATNNRSNDSGRLTAGCTEGLICLGAVRANGIFQIGALGAPIAASITGPTTVRQLDVNAITDITFGDGSSAFTIEGFNSFRARAQQGNIILSGPVSLSGGPDFVLTAGSGIVGPQGSILGTADLAITAPGGIQLAGLDVAGQTILVASLGTIDVSGIRSGTLNATGRAISLAGPGAFNATTLAATGTSIEVNFGGNITIGTAGSTGALGVTSTAGNIDITAIGNSQLTPSNIDLKAFGNATVGNAASLGSLNISAGSLATVNGTLTAPQIRLTSADIVIGGNARIGSVSGTNQLTFASTAATTTIGGSSTGAGYRLSEAEFLRAFANNVTAVALPGGQLQDSIDPNAVPTLTLDSLNVGAANTQGIGNLGSAGALRFQTNGTMRVVGAVKLTNASADSRLEMVAGPALQVRPGGSASVVNGTNLTGVLELTAADIIASDADTLGALANTTTVKDQSDRLGLNPGATDDTGFFAANTINANVRHGFYIQNTGVTQPVGSRQYDPRRGFTVGTGGLSITPNSQTAITIAINGRQVSSAAAVGYITGTALLPLVALNTDGADLIAKGSTINGCIIGGNSCTATSVLGGIEPGSVARDTIEELIAGELDAASSSVNTPNVLIELPAFSSVIGQPLIEDPVTGSGNDDLLADKDGKQCDPSVETCTKE